jgi:hypothetical protein
VSAQEGWALPQEESALALERKVMASAQEESASAQEWTSAQETSALALEDWVPVSLEVRSNRCVCLGGVDPPNYTACPQLYWAWLKNRDLAVTISGTPDRVCWKFRQEYPATASEAFRMSGEDPFIPLDRVARARKAQIAGYGPLILGVDPARGGKDKTGLIDRQGRRLGGHVKECIDSDDLMHIVGVVVRKIDELRPKGLKKVVIDVTGLGAGIYDRLREQGYGSLVEGVNFGSKALELHRYVNRRAEMWDRKREWYDDPAGVEVPDDDLFQRDECSVVRGNGATKFDSAGRLLLESKDHIRSRVGFSPDLGDAAALTFAIDFNNVIDESEERYRPSRPGRGSNAWLGS